MKSLVDKLEQSHMLSNGEFYALLTCDDADVTDYLKERAVAVRKGIYGTDVYIRGLIEFTNHCKNDCLYCGIRRSNKNAVRYRLDDGQIFQCAENGYELGFRTFVLQGGEDMYYTDSKIAHIVSKLKETYPDCAVTLSIGEKSRESYKLYFDAGADRYLLRHETANNEHYTMLHPKELSLDNRKRCLYDLKDIGYQVGCGFMVGSPFQTVRNIIEDLRFIRELEPHMVGIGPFIPHRDTPFADKAAGTLEMTLKLLSIIRLMLPNVLLPSTTALGTIHPNGRELGILSGANVVMPNLSPADVRKKYLLYDNKICTGDEAAECVRCLQMRMEGIGYRIVQNKGDFRKI